jgi:phosphoglycerate kinase
MRLRFGGAKADDSLEISKYVLDNKIADYVLNRRCCGTCLSSGKGVDLGKPNMKFLEEKKLMGLVPGIKELMESIQTKLRFQQTWPWKWKKNERNPVEKLPTDYPIFDIGAKTVENYAKIIRNAKSIVVSGPMGVFENSEFIYGTKRIFEEIANSKAFSLAGGGHTIAALQELGLSNKISYVSTAGGALIEFLMGKKLPGVVALEKAAARKPSVFPSLFLFVSYFLQQGLQLWLLLVPAYAEAFIYLRSLFSSLPPCKVLQNPFSAVFSPPFCPFRVA